MTWFEKSNAAKPTPIVFSDRSSSTRTVPSWLAAQQTETTPSQPKLFALRSQALRPMEALGHHDAISERSPFGSCDSMMQETVDEPMDRGTVKERRPNVVLSEHPSVIPMPMVDDRLARAKEAAVKGLEEAILSLHAERQRVLRQSEQQLVKLAGKIARKVIGREIAIDPTVVFALASEGITALNERERVRVRIGTAVDDDILRASLERLKAQVPQCEVVVDPSLGVGGCVVETEMGRVDESVDSRLDNIMNALLMASEAPPGRGG